MMDRAAITTDGGLWIVMKKGGLAMKLTRKEIGKLLKLPDRHITIDEALYDPDFPDEIELFKVLDENDPDFSSHIPDYPIYPDYAVYKLVNQGIRLLIAILYPDLNGCPCGHDRTYKTEGETLSQ